MNLDRLLFRDVNAQYVTFFINIAEDDDLYYMLIAVLDDENVWIIATFCGTFEIDDRAQRFKMLDLSPDILTFSKNKLLNRKYTEETNKLERRLLVVSKT